MAIFNSYVSSPEGILGCRLAFLSHWAGSKPSWCAPMGAIRARWKPLGRTRSLKIMWREKENDQNMRIPLFLLAIMIMIIIIIIIITYHIISYHIISYHIISSSSSSSSRRQPQYFLSLSSLQGQGPPRRSHHPLGSGARPKRPEPRQIVPGCWGNPWVSHLYRIYAHSRAEIFGYLHLSPLFLPSTWSANLVSCWRTQLIAVGRLDHLIIRLGQHPGTHVVHVKVAASYHYGYSSLSKF